MLSFLSRSSAERPAPTKVVEKPAEAATSTVPATINPPDTLPVPKGATSEEASQISSVTSRSAEEEATDSSSTSEEPPSVASPTTEPESNNMLAAKPGDAVPPEPSPEQPAHPLSNERRRFAWRSSLSFFGGDKREGHKDHKAQLSAIQEHKKAQQAAAEHDVYALKLSRSERKAKASAQVVRSLIVGPSSIKPSQMKAKPVSKRKIEQVKSELIHKKSANRVIAQLRAMPASDQETGVSTVIHPIHAVCLAYTDLDAHERHFARLNEDANGADGDDSELTKERSFSIAAAVTSVADVTNASISRVTAMFTDLHVVSLVATPDLGLGQPGEGPGLLRGALPPAETVLEGVQQVTPQLLALGYATGKAIYPDHAGVYPPTDRMSVITYWWGFEVVLPPPSLKYLSNVPSITHAIINFLTGLSLVYNGVREILPFIRYISQYIDAEFNMIKDNDRGKGVVCAATWIMPAALVPRPWDFPTPPPGAPGAPNPAPGTPGDNDEDGEGPAASQPPQTMMPLPLPGHPPLPIGFMQLQSAPPIDDTPLEVVGTPDDNVPDVKVTPPTPPAASTLRGVPEGLVTERPLQTAAVVIPSVA
ncbi:hypothetical protein BXZ70DRAFT_900614 [Cristinia sonorae]|uniref:Uncharacterized protein n=1 Tax=Cristinia sonorae TaxID=1940300 RepID=A0A8K0UF23_9AGAR|nr:hypothetical protein BXZ70DRAFT_900614 [Cristinia sonorae]